MKCIVPGLNIKIFARAMHSLAKIGDELYVESSSEGVSFRTVDSSRSAFGSFFFRSNFFSLYDYKDADEQNLKCKVAMKACLNAFRMANNIDKIVEKCKLIINPEEDSLIICMSCRHGINKTYNLAFIECETLQAVFDKDNCPFGIISPSRVLCDALVNFHSNQEEVTLEVNPQKTVIRNYINDGLDPTKAIHTELTMEPEEFDDYKVGNNNCEITFSLKELRALLTFSEPVNLPISIIFNKPGLPIIFYIENGSVFEANFVLATLSPNELPNHHHATAESVRQKHAKNSLNKINEKTDKSNSGRSILGESIRNHHSSSYISEAEEVNKSPKLVNKTSNNFYNSPADARVNFSQINHSTNGVSFRQEIANACIVNANNTIVDNEHLSNDQEQFSNNQKLRDCNDDNEIPGTPPAKRKKYFFKRCFEPTFHAENISQFNRVLAEDSDDEHL